MADKRLEAVPARDGAGMRCEAGGAAAPAASSLGSAIPPPRLLAVPDASGPPANDAASTTVAERRARREDSPQMLRWIALARSLAATLDLVQQPLLLATPDEPMRLWHASSAAWPFLLPDQAMHVDGGLLLPHPACADRLRMATAKAAVPGGDVTVDLPCGPALTQQVRIQSVDFGAAPDLPVTALLLLRFPPRASDPPSEILQRGFGLTRKEAECALGLYATGSIESYARAAGKSIHTARTQLKAVMSKTGTRTQAGLMALLGRRLSP